VAEDAVPLLDRRGDARRRVEGTAAKLRHASPE
jgi:hypothetical protein